MKYKSSYAFSVIALLVFCIIPGCKDDPPTPEIDKLPPLTSEGKNTFGCLVNGKAMVTHFQPGVTAIYQQGNLQLGAEVEVGDIDQAIDMFLNDPLEVGISYDLVSRSIYRDLSLSNGCYYDIDDTILGSLTFSKIDRSNFIVSGTFAFSSVNAQCDTVRITDGRFDLQYTP